MAKKMNFPGALANGEARGRKRYYGGEAEAPPYGFRAQTVNGTAHCEGLGWNQDYEYSEPAAQEGGAWQPGGNRTGE